MMELISPLYGALAPSLIRRFTGGPTPHRTLMTLGAVAVAALAWTFAPGVVVVTAFLGWALLALAAIDVLAYRLPDVFTFSLLVAGLVAPEAPASHWERIIGAGAGFLALVALELLYTRVRGRSGMGLGDAKLLAAAGAWLGWSRLPEVLLLASVGGLVWVALRVLTRGRAELGRAVPYGAPLCAALWLSWMLS